MKYTRCCGALTQSTVAKLMSRVAVHPFLSKREVLFSWNSSVHDIARGYPPHNYLIKRRRNKSNASEYALRRPEIRTDRRFPTVYSLHYVIEERCFACVSMHGLRNLFLFACLGVIFERSACGDEYSRHHRANYIRCRAASLATKLLHLAVIISQRDDRVVWQHRVAERLLTTR